jgi:hypothetical protein
VLRDCLSGEALLARSLLSACEAELADLLREVQQALEVPIRGVISITAVEKNRKKYKNNGRKNACKELHILRSFYVVDISTGTLASTFCIGRSE